MLDNVSVTLPEISGLLVEQHVRKATKIAT